VCGCRCLYRIVYVRAAFILHQPSTDHLANVASHPGTGALPIVPTQGDWPFLVKLFENRTVTMLQALYEVVRPLLGSE